MALPATATATHAVLVMAPRVRAPQPSRRAAAKQLTQRTAACSVARAVFSSSPNTAHRYERCDHPATRLPTTPHGVSPASSGTSDVIDIVAPHEWGEFDRLCWSTAGTQIGRAHV